MIQSLVEFCGHRREDRRESCSRRRPWNRKIEFDCCSIHRIFPGKRISVASTYSPPTGRVPITIIDTPASPWGEAPYKDATERTTLEKLGADIL
ncbi:hypothetical protein OIU84_013554 [Salix udensis]|uniref:Uncharacterized protein n=1 Tax=Salix udensis TaxID=889485 RepID=A0AAD6JI97_9ROSI|nr:hypothetical protein OIU84_013554 [Salix udensis]KAJ6405616.1 hypothetical protein OIU84_013554 [Salix udensis]KAJ6405617.1 hypothetical protein OIU84_013554 [Salix udensis]